MRLTTPGPAGPPPLEQPVRWLSCEHPRTEVRRRVQSNGVVVACRQCLECGRSLGAVPKSGLPLADLPAYDDGLHDAWVARSREFTDRQRGDRDAAWQAWYAAYVASPEWQRVRAKVLERDSYLCQGCRYARATQVHHLTYARVGAELLIDLVAVCDGCHDRLHPGKR